MKVSKKEVWRAVKFTLFSISAGVIQFVSSLLLKLVILDRVMDPDATMHFIIEQPTSTFIADTVGLALSILWNFTFNRKFTFKAASNVPIAMLLAFVFYIPFYPFQIWYVATIEDALVNIGGWGFIIGLGTCMIINFVLEFLWQQFVVFRGKVDTNDLAKKQQEKEAAAAEVSVENSVQVTVNITNNGADAGTNEKNNTDVTTPDIKENTQKIKK